MTREQAEQIARKHCGAAFPHYIPYWVVPAIMEAAAIERADEREACALMVDHVLRPSGGTYGDKIRARGER